MVLLCFALSVAAPWLLFCCEAAVRLPVHLDAILGHPLGHFSFHWILNVFKIGFAGEMTALAIDDPQWMN